MPFLGAIASRAQAAPKAHCWPKKRTNSGRGRRHARVRTRRVGDPFPCRSSEGYRKHLIVLEKAKQLPAGEHDRRTLAMRAANEPRMGDVGAAAKHCRKSLVVTATNTQGHGGSQRHFCSGVSITPIGDLW